MLNCVTISNIESVRIAPNNIINKELIAKDSILFANPVINFCLEPNNNILVLDANLEKIFKIDLNNFQSIETILLPQKINFLKGIASDGSYIYLYTENSLFRFDKYKRQLVSLINPKDKIKITDLTTTQQGEIFISDDLNSQIVFINTLGKIQLFNLSLKTLFTPAGIYFDNLTNRLWIINHAQQQIEVYLRNGNLDKIIKLIDFSSSKILINKNNIFIFDKRSGNISQIKEGSIINYLYPNQKTILIFVVSENSILMLKSNTVLKYQL